MSDDTGRCEMCKLTLDGASVVHAQRRVRSADGTEWTPVGPVTFHEYCYPHGSLAYVRQ